MKISFGLLIASLLSISAPAQNWQAAYLHEHFEYTSASDPALTESIYLESPDYNLETDGHFLWRLNEAACANDPNSWCQSDCYKIDFSFLQREIKYFDEGVMEFQYPDTFRIATLAQLGEEWIFGNDENGDEITATVVSVGDTLILGVPDSLKVIALDGSPAIYLSKNHGIIGWYVDDSDFELTAIPGRNLNGSQLTTADIFDFEVGDQLAYFSRRSTQSTGPFEVTAHTSILIEKMEILDISYDSNAIILEVALSTSGRINNHPYQQPDQAVTISQIDTLLAPIDLERTNILVSLPGAHVVKYRLDDSYFELPGFQPFAFPPLQNTSFPSDRQLEAFSYSGFLEERVFIGHGVRQHFFPPLPETSVDALINSPPELSAFMAIDWFHVCDVASWPFANDTATILAKSSPAFGVGFDYAYEIPWGVDQTYFSLTEGLGYTDFFQAGKYLGSSNSFFSSLIGYQKNGETVGYLPTDEELLLVPVASRELANQINVYPNPSSGQMRLLLPENIAFNTWRLIDISGRQIAFGKINGFEQQISLDLGVHSGIYLLSLETADGRSASERVQIIK